MSHVNFRVVLPIQKKFYIILLTPMTKLDCLYMSVPNEHIDL
jgi:hypothetical protein